MRNTKAKHATLKTTRNRLIAGLIVAAMLLCASLCLVVAMEPASAENSAYGSGAVCAPSSTIKNLPLTDQFSQYNKDDPDTDVATYVGGNMYVGSPYKLNSEGTAYTTDSNIVDGNVTGLTGSYAAEAEGLTLVEGRLLMRQVKRSWSGWGFRFGAAGFGSQWRPAPGQSVLAVKGDNKSNVTGVKADDGSSTAVDSTSSVVAWKPDDSDAGRGGGWIGTTRTENENTTNGIANDTVDYTATVTSDNAVADEFNNTGKSLTHVTARNQNTTYNGWTVDGNLTVNGKTLAERQNQVNLSGESTELLNLTATGTVTYGGTAPTANFTRYKYDYWRDKNNSYKFDFNNSGTQQVSEQLITLTGDGESGVQVFNLDADRLAEEGTSGTSFWFRNIPENAAVVVNVGKLSGGKILTTDAGANTIDFHNGWRVWWSTPDQYDADDDEPDDTNSEEIGGYYSAQSKDTSNTTRVTTLYAKRAQQLVWNFPKTTSLTIRGGQGSGTQTHVIDGSSTGTKTMNVYDDPAAAWIGSIYVPNGSFDSHVTTNGRVYVGGDFLMDNPLAVKDSDGNYFTDWESSKSSSVVDMDQERHNYPAPTISACSAITWGKSDVNGTLITDQSTWGVYATAGDADTRSNPLVLVTDGKVNDKDISKTPIADSTTADGRIVVTNLQPERKYYIRELIAPTGYKLNENIYYAETSQSGYDTSKLNKLETNTTSDASGKLTVTSGTTTGDSLISVPDDAQPTGEITWEKHADTSGGTLLPGSSWPLTKKTGADSDDDAAKWIVKDITKKAHAIAISTTAASTVNGGTTYYDVSDGAQFTATVSASDGSTDSVNQQVTWEVADDKVAAVTTGGKVYGLDGGTTTVRACTAINGDTNAKVCSDNINVYAVGLLQVTRDNRQLAALTGNVYRQQTTTASPITLETPTTITLTTTTTPAWAKTTWTSSDTSVATVTANNGTTTVNVTGYGTTTISVKAGNKTIDIPITVGTTIYFQRPEGYKYKDITFSYPTFYLEGLAYDGSYSNQWERKKYNDRNWILQQATCDPDYYVISVKMNPDMHGWAFKFHDSNDTWYPDSGNMNLPKSGQYATVTVRDDRTAYTVDASRPASCSTVDAADGTMDVYFYRQKTNKMMIHYNPGSGSWLDVDLNESICDGNTSYFVGYISKGNSGDEFLPHDLANTWWKTKGTSGDNFKFNGTAVNTITSPGDQTAASTAPTGCQAVSSASSAKPAATWSDWDDEEDEEPTAPAAEEPSTAAETPTPSVSVGNEEPESTASASADSAPSPETTGDATMNPTDEPTKAEAEDPGTSPAATPSETASPSPTADTTEPSSEPTPTATDAASETTSGDSTDSLTVAAADLDAATRGTMASLDGNIIGGFTTVKANGPTLQSKRRRMPPSRTVTCDATDLTTNPNGCETDEADTDTGVLRITGLEDGSYTLVEITAPGGYDLNTTVFRFTIANGEVAWTGTKDNSTDNVTDSSAWDTAGKKLTISDTRSTGSVEVGKVASLANGASVDNGTRFSFTNAFEGSSLDTSLTGGTYTLEFYKYTSSTSADNQTDIASPTVASSGSGITVAESPSSTPFFTCVTGCGTDGDGKPTITLSTTSGSTTTVSVAAGYGYRITGLPQGSKVTVQETGITDTNVYDFQKFISTCVSSDEYSGQCEITGTDTGSTSGTSKQTVTLTVGYSKPRTTSDKTAHAAAAVYATNDVKKTPVVPVVLPNTGGNFGGIWIYFLVGALILVAGFATYVYDLRRRSA